MVMRKRQLSKRSHRVCDYWIQSRVILSENNIPCEKRLTSETLYSFASVSHTGIQKTTNKAIFQNKPLSPQTNTSSIDRKEFEAGMEKRQEKCNKGGSHLSHPPPISRRRKGERQGDARLASQKSRSRMLGPCENRTVRQNKLVFFTLAALRDGHIPSYGL